MEKIHLLFCVLGLVFASQAFAMEAYKPGEVWDDAEGNPINAHGGGMLYHEGAYYWYGEMKTGKTWMPKSNASWGGSRVDVTGVSCYSSRDLLNWKPEGNVLPANQDDPTHDLHTSKVVERPKVIYNRATGKFVMWMHIDSMNYGKASVGVAISDSPTGPFTYLYSIRPNKGVWPKNADEADKQSDPPAHYVRDHEKGQMARDMTLFVDDDQRAYLFYSAEENATHHIALLNDDYTQLTGQYKRVFIDRSMEAPAVFKRDGRYYFIASGCTAWHPNPARSAVADSIWGPWTELGNPCVGKNSDVTFYSQSTYVLPIQGKDDAYIFMADRWNPKNLEDSRYVWLPIEFNGDRPEVRWQDKWSTAWFDAQPSQ